MKKVGKTTRPFKYDLNKTLYDYTVELTNKLKGLDLIERVPEELYKKDLHDPDNHDGVITNLEPDILECKVKSMGVRKHDYKQS